MSRCYVRKTFPNNTNSLMKFYRKKIALFENNCRESELAGGLSITVTGEHREPGPQSDSGERAEAALDKNGGRGQGLPVNELHLNLKSWLSSVSSPLSSGAKPMRRHPRREGKASFPVCLLTLFSSCSKEVRMRLP